MLYKRWRLIDPQAIAVVFFAAALLLALVVAGIWISTASALTGLCHVLDGAPVLSTSLPSYVFVLTAVGAFVAGHFTNRFGVEARPELAVPLEDAKFARRGIVLLVKLIAAGFLLIVTVINVVEVVTLAGHDWPITFYVRCATDANPLISLFGAAVFSFLTGRWLWIAR